MWAQFKSLNVEVMPVASLDGFQVLKDHLLLFRLPRDDSPLGFHTYDELPPIRAKRLERVLALGEGGKK